MLAGALLLAPGLSAIAGGQCVLPTALNHQRISGQEAGIPGGGPLSFGPNFSFGEALASLGDLDGDGVGDVVVGSPTVGPDSAVAIVFLTPDGSPGRFHLIPAGSLPTSAPTHTAGFFGGALAPLGDLDGDGVVDLAVGDRRDTEIGAVWILFMAEDGSVRSAGKINDEHGGFAGSLADGDWFGHSLANLGDLDGDGRDELAVGVYGDDDGGPDRGAVWILFLDSEGTVTKQQKISDTAGGFAGGLHDLDHFGFSVASPGDVDGDGVPDLAVGSPFDDVAGEYLGVVWVLFLASDGTVKHSQALRPRNPAAGGAFDGVRALGKSLGSGGAWGDGAAGRLLIGASHTSDNDGGVWFVELAADGTLVEHHVVGPDAGGYVAPSSPVDGLFASSVTLLEDVDGDGFRDLAVGRDGLASFMGLPPGAPGNATIVLLDQAPQHEPTKISSGTGGFAGPLLDGDSFGAALAAHVQSARVELAVGVPGDDDGDGNNSGGVWVLDLDSSGTVQGQSKISVGHGLPTSVGPQDALGSALAWLGDLDGDGLLDLAAGAPADGGLFTPLEPGAVWILFGASQGTVLGFQQISTTMGGLAPLLAQTKFGSALANVGDLDGDGVIDLAVGGPGALGPAGRSGAVWILFLNPDGTVNSEHVLDGSAPALMAGLAPDDQFGFALAVLGDLDGDRVVDLAVGAPGDDDGGTNRGALWVLFLQPDGSIKSATKIADGSGFPGTLRDGDRLGTSLTVLGDVDGDGVVDLGVGATGDDGFGSNRGALWVLFLRPDGTVRTHLKVSNTDDGAYVSLDNADRFGRCMAWGGDLDGDGVGELFVGAPGDDDGGNKRGAVWKLCLNPGSWQGTGGGLSGTQGVPRLAGQGTLVAGAPLTLTLTSARQQSVATLVIGFSELQAPLHGGVLVPQPDVVLFGLPVDDSGAHVFRGRWPAGLPAETRIWVQSWIVDPQGRQGWAASNAVVGRAP